ncbi:MAG: hypothetical protein V7L11_08220 [Nostoc sp.]
MVFNYRMYVDGIGISNFHKFKNCVGAAGRRYRSNVGKAIAQFSR